MKLGFVFYRYEADSWNVVWGINSDAVDWELVYVKGFPSEASLVFRHERPPLEIGDRMDVLSLEENAGPLHVWRGWISAIVRSGANYTVQLEGLYETCKRLRVSLCSPFAVSVGSLLESLASSLAHPRRLGVPMRVVTQLRTAFSLPYGVSLSVSELLDRIAAMFPEGRLGAGFSEGVYELGVFQDTPSQLFHLDGIAESEEWGPYGSCVSVLGGAPFQLNYVPNGDFVDAGQVVANLVPNWNFYTSGGWIYNSQAWSRVNSEIDENYAFLKISNQNLPLSMESDASFQEFSPNGTFRNLFLVGAVLVKIPASSNTSSVNYVLSLKVNDVEVRVINSLKEYLPSSESREDLLICPVGYVNPSVNRARVSLYASQGVMVDNVQLLLLESPRDWELYASVWANTYAHPDYTAYFRPEPAASGESTSGFAGVPFRIQVTVENASQYCYLSSKPIPVPKEGVFNAYVFFLGHDPKLVLDYYDQNMNFVVRDVYLGEVTEEVNAGVTVYRRRYIGVWAGQYPYVRVGVGFGGSYPNYPVSKSCILIGVVVTDPSQGTRPLYPYTERLYAHAQILNPDSAFHTYRVETEVSSQEGLVSFLNAWQQRRGQPARALVVRTVPRPILLRSHEYSAVYEGVRYRISRVVVRPSVAYVYLGEDVHSFKSILYRLASQLSLPLTR